MATPIAIVAYLGLFAGVAVLFLFVNLVVGRFLRPRLPNQEKLEVYECGEPTIGSSFVQFDLRFYVVALLFIIFDVEVAFFFPWATVFGKATQLTAPNMPVVMADLDPDGGAPEQLTPQAIARLRELGVRDPSPATIGALSPAERRELGDVGESALKASVQSSARQMAMASLWDIGVFFAVLMVGFAYVWRRGDLNWVRSVRSHAGEVVERAPVTLELEQKRGRPAGSILSA
ncbi:NADH-quinone oxidoreductase subunit A [Lacipirellula limnantheis]|uniref:NADH-quinone oxidoreductase subunit n=1 Tax=Lacipirellula limnantheis TaxID=2528024 RepID=A0A517TWR0_9BACT|nr:NADH-quinone oxidoreductase subunit A [Lacipirellula limnantheis]QDT72807.1 NAD(P)H-quinone oxidoreductase subunit 3 [Lacipirellula limnantheis]